MGRLRVLCFSKDRPLQLTAYIESLLHYSGLSEDVLSVIYRESGAYEQLRCEYPGCRWIAERGPDGFDAALRNAAAEFSDRDSILFGCDDVVFLRHFCPREMVSILEVNPTEGFSLRRGGQPPLTEDGRLRCGEIPYPFELMASAFRGSLVRAVVNSQDGGFRIPNDLESVGLGYARKNRLLQRMWLYDGMAVAVAQDVNRVQDIYPNQVRGTGEHAPELLVAKYLAGYRLDWRSMGNVNATGPFIGGRCWRLLGPRAVGDKADLDREK